MKGICRFRLDGQTHIGLYDSETGRVGVLHHAPNDWRTALELLKPGSDGTLGLDHLTISQSLEESEVEFLPPVDEHCRVFCVAQNYQAHAQESSGTAAPPEPVIFLKPNSALVGHQQATILPKAAAQFDWEAEAVVVVGDHLDQASVSAASDAIIGWSIANDGTARDLQPIELGGRTIIDWFSAKSIDNSSAIGPAVFPAAAISDPDGMRLRLSRNGEEMQNDVLSLMVVSPPRLLSHISRVVSLRPGDVLLTGTPAGVGKARGIFMDAGDYLEITLEPLGTLTTRIEA